jgi:MFS family permease
MKLGIAMVVFSIATLPGLALLPFTDNNVIWVILRLFSGLATAVPWVLGETWINLATKSSWRARTTAIYGAAIAGGFALGPISLTFFENQLDLAIAAFTVLSFLSIFPLLPILRFAPSFPHEKGAGFFSHIYTMPVVFCAVMLAAVADMAFATFLPLWSTDQGLSMVIAMILVSTMMIGNVVLQFPIGMMADRIGLRQTMRLCGVVSVIAPVLIVVVGVELVLLVPILFIYGGAVWALYSLALADLGHRLTGAALASANGAVVFVYTASNVVGPPISGAGLNIWYPHGFMIVAFAAALVFVVLAFIRPDPAKHPAKDPAP